MYFEVALANLDIFCKKTVLRLGRDSKFIQPEDYGTAVVFSLR